MSLMALIEHRSRRIRHIVITPELILELLKVKDVGTVVDGKLLTFAESPIPDSATALRCGLNERGDIVMLIEDESFVEVAEGDQCQPLRPFYKWELVNNAEVVVGHGLEYTEQPQGE